MQLDSVNGQRILYSALNWGSGHVSRSIGIINQLRQQQNEILIACSNWQATIFRAYFPELPYLFLDDYPFQFSGNGNFGIDLLKRSGALKSFRKDERRKVKEWVETYQIDLILSDHRYGFYHANVPSVFITHQLNLPVKGIAKVADIVHTKWMQKFHHIWVVDDENCQFAGKLSKNKKELSCTYIGPQSRFKGIGATPKMGKVVLLSGPYPYSLQLLDELHSDSRDSVVIGPQYLKPNIDPSIDYRFGDWNELDDLLIGASTIISRSGYSTLMDAYFLKTNLEMYPTKGQAEQIYLFERWNGKTDFRS